MSNPPPDTPILLTAKGEAMLKAGDLSAEEIAKLPGCGLSARQLGLACQKRRPPKGYTLCRLGKFHDGDCVYPRAEP